MEIVQQAQLGLQQTGPSLKIVLNRYICLKSPGIFIVLVPLIPECDVSCFRVY